MSFAIKNDPELWEEVKAEGMEKFGKWSARLAQWAVREYKKRGGGYIGPKSEDNSLSRWTREDWTTKSGLPSGITGERYLPREVIEKLFAEEYEETTEKKRIDTLLGKQWSKQPEQIATKTSVLRRSIE